jgi:predicted  nucleic acid-binding Zn-ribbon protein
MSNSTIPHNLQDQGPSSDEAPPESLDKVRDILFGGQMRAVESRLQGLESRLLQAQESLRSEFTKHLETLDGTLQKEVQALGERLGSERDKRTEELKALGAELKESLKQLEKRHLKLEETSGNADADLREGILQQGKAISAEISRVAERLTGELTRSVQELKAEKVNLTALSSLFADMASRLNGDAGAAAKHATRG